MTDWQAARPQYVSLDTPHGRLELTWPLPQQVTAEGLEPVAAIMVQDPAPTARLNGTLITIQRARQIVAGMRRTSEAMTIPEPDRAKYGHMPVHLYWEMLEGEDPDDRAIREAHGIGYEESYSADVTCRNGCGLNYAEISGGKIRECLATVQLRRALADRDAEIARLHAELDGMREVPVEYAPTAALEAAMNADPGREDGTILRETGGERRAFEWKAQAGEWVRI